MQRRQNGYRDVLNLSVDRCTHVVFGEDGGLEELDVEGWDDDVLERLADLGVAEELPDDGAEVLAVVLGARHVLEQAQRTAAARRTHHTFTSQTTMTRTLAI